MPLFYIHTRLGRVDVTALETHADMGHAYRAARLRYGDSAPIHISQTPSPGDAPMENPTSPIRALPTALAAGRTVTAPTQTILPKVLTPSRVARLGLQNSVVRRLRSEGCRVLACSDPMQARLSIQVAPPAAGCSQSLLPTRRNMPGLPPVFEALLDGVRVWWVGAAAQEVSHAA